MRNEAYGRYPIAKSGNPFTCGLTGKTYTATEAFDRCDNLSKGLAKITGWEPNVDSPWDKVIAVFSFNTVSIRPGMISEHEELTPLSPTTDRLRIRPTLGSPLVGNRNTRQCRLLG